MWKAIKAWYLKTFLPFEDPANPNYTEPPYDAGEDPEWDLIEDAPYQFTYKVNDGETKTFPEKD
jgi:hypothetical protein